MKLIVRKQNGGDATPEQKAAVENALNAVLAQSKFSFEDAMLAMDEIVYRAETAPDRRRRRGVLANEPEPFAAFHDERLALHDALMGAAAQAAGEPVHYFKIEGDADPSRFR